MAVLLSAEDSVVEPVTTAQYAAPLKKKAAIFTANAPKDVAAMGLYVEDTVNLQNIAIPTMREGTVSVGCFAAHRSRIRWAIARRARIVRISAMNVGEEQMRV